MDIHAAVMAFHRLYGIPIGVDGWKLVPDRRDLRLRLIDEEVDELKEAVESDDVIEIADALGDIVYVAFGMAIEMGVNLNDVIAEIQRSNLSKLGGDGLPIINQCQRFDECDPSFACRKISHYNDHTLPHGKVLKGPNYSKPDLWAVHDSQKPLT